MNLLPDYSMLAVMVIFWITYWLLRAFVFKPVQEILRERRETVETARAEHDEALARTDAKIEAERERLNQARVEAAAQRDRLRREAEEKRQEILAQTRDETGAKVGEAQEELEATVARERETLEERARGLAGRMTDKLLEKSA